LTFVWKHPKFYKDLATNYRRDKTTQKGEEDERATSGKQQASSDKRSENKQASHEDS